ncbi:hypothetical protein FFF34_006995 [Inquilinus sp. KBS0705]|nr:hypothetical protein FFF34_006995 [Inquilinus sp. KBS0705]
MLKRLLLPLILLTATMARAQQFGGNPPSIKWRQVNTPTAKVIFSQGMDSVALRVAATIQQMSTYIKPTIGFKQKQVSIVLQNQTTISNAYVGLAPFRSEFYLTPDQNSFEIGSLPWPEQLAIHEFRHVQQYNNFNVGVSHALRFVFGEGGQALGNALSVPDWFFEGDAVYNETLVSKQGRGRLPYFFNGYRALWAAGRDYSWMKLRNGSYIDYTPNHYPLGYMLVAYGREKYGSAFWKNVTHDAAAFNTGFYPLQGAIKKYSGSNYTQFRNAALGHFKEQFKADGIKRADKKQHFIANMEYPAYADDNTIIYLKTAYNHVPVFIVKNGDAEKTIAVKSISTDDYFAYNNGKIMYAAYRPDARWRYRNYNELVILDVNTGKEHRITRKTKYFSPVFSNNGKTIAAVQVDPSGKSELHLLDTDGRLLSILPNPDKLFYTYPQFYGNDLVAAVRNTAGKMSIAVINSQTGSAKYLLPFSFEPLGFTKIQGDTVYFTKTSGLNDKLYALAIGSNKLFAVNVANNGSVGAYQPALSNNKLAWVGFTAFGYQLNQANRADVPLTELNPSQVSALSNIGISNLAVDSSANILAAINPQPLPVTKYGKLHGLFNFHSLFPNLNDPDYSLELAGENVLNTFQSRIVFDYNRDEGYKQIGYEAIYGGLYPYILAGADYTFDRRGFYNGGNVYYNETALHAGLQVPLDLTVGGHSTSLSASSFLYYSRNSFQQAYRNVLNDTHYTYLSNTLSFNNQMQQAKQHINPHFAQSISVNYKSAVEGLKANQLLTTGAFYFPGLWVNHSLVISGAYQHSGQNNGIGFSNNFPFSKGYTAQNLDNMNKFGASYHFPIAYPDAGVGNTLYLMRIRGNVFYDNTHATAFNFYNDGSTFKGNFRSVGAALFFDGKLFNQGAVSLGFRYSYLLDRDVFGGSGKNRFEIVLPVSLF